MYATINGETTAQCQADGTGGLGGDATATPIDANAITQASACTVTDPSEPGVSITLYPVTGSAADKATATLVCGAAQSAANSDGSSSTAAVVHHRPQHEHVNSDGMLS